MTDEDIVDKLVSDRVNSLASRPMRRRRPKLMCLKIFVGLFASPLLAIAFVCGCGAWGARAINAADTVVYERELDNCIKLARPTHNFAVYESCARAVDRKHGVDGGAP